MTPSWRARATLSLGLAAGVVLGVPAVALAHVTVNPNSATAGSYATLTFKVPTESATASTTKLEVDLPTDHPFGSVSYQPVAGWTTVVTTSKLATPVTTDDGTIDEAPTKIVWIASKGAAIKPGQFQAFAISVGPVPSADSVRFAAHQTYSDGSVVNWDEPVPASGEEPEHPAPTLYINASPPGASASPTASATPGTTSAAEANSMASMSTQDSTARWYGIGGLLLGAVALVLGAYAVMRRPHA